MKKFKTLIALMVAFGAIVTVTSCTTISPKSWTTPASVLVEKDYEVIGRVTVEKKITKILFFNFGGRIGYDELLKEAEKKYPDCQEVINLKTDVIGNKLMPDGYIMSGLAIKYRN